MNTEDEGLVGKLNKVRGMVGLGDIMIIMTVNILIHSVTVMSAEHQN